MTTPRFCTQCGRPLAIEARFCAQCGSPVRQGTVPVAVTPVPAPPPPPSPLPGPPPAALGMAAPAPVEAILNVTPGVQRKKGFLGMGVDTFSLAITPGRLIFAHLDNRAMQAYVTRARDQAKAAGKGFLGQMGAQLSWVRLLEEDLLKASPEQMLAQDPSSFYIPVNAVTKVQLRESRDPEDQTSNAIQIVIHAASGKQRFQLPTTMNVSRRELKRRLQQALGDRVR